MQRERRVAGTTECGPCNSGHFGLLYQGKEQVSFVCNAVRARQIVCMCVETRLRKQCTRGQATLWRTGRPSRCCFAAMSWSSHRGDWHTGLVATFLTFFRWLHFIVSQLSYKSRITKTPILSSQTYWRSCLYLIMRHTFDLRTPINSQIYGSPRSAFDNIEYFPSENLKFKEA